MSICLKDIIEDNSIDCTMIHEKCCGAVVYKIANKEIQYLILKSIEPDGFWGFPKGHMENLETEEDTALREVFEESGLKVKLIDEFRASDKYIINNIIEKEVVFFLGEAENVKPEIQVEEIVEYKWCNYTDAHNLLTFDSGKKILDEASEFLNTYLDLNS